MWERGGDELSLGSHLALSCYCWGMALSPLLDGRKSMGYTLARRENMVSLGAGGKSWSWLCTLVCTLQSGWVQPLAEAEYINKLFQESLPPLLGKNVHQLYSMILEAFSRIYYPDLLEPFPTKLVFFSLS